MNSTGELLAAAAAAALFRQPGLGTMQLHLHARQRAQTAAQPPHEAQPPRRCTHPPDFVHVLPLGVPLEGLGGGAGDGQALTGDGQAGHTSVGTVLPLLQGCNHCPPSRPPPPRLQVHTHMRVGPRLPASLAPSLLPSLPPCLPGPRLPTWGTVLMASGWGKCDSKMERSRKYSRVRGGCTGKRSNRVSHMSSVTTWGTDGAGRGAES